MQKVVLRSRLVFAVVASLLAALLIGVAPGLSNASSHREAPLISNDPQADATDVYAFVSPDLSNTVSLIADYIPLEAPYGGPNFYRFADDVLYEIKLDNVGDAQTHIKYQFRFHSAVGNQATFLYNTCPITTTPSACLNVLQTYTVTEVMSDSVGITSTVLATDVRVPTTNIGSASTPNYDALGDAGVCTIAINGSGNPSSLTPTCNTRNVTQGPNDIKVFAGPRDDPFFVDLGSVFDLLHLRGQAAPVGYPAGPGNIPLDGLAGYNVHSLALQIPTARLTKQGDPVIGVWSTASRRSTRVLLGIGGVIAGSGVMTESGPYVQVSRLGMPLTNEAVLPIALKDAFNSLDPSTDLTLYGPAAPYVGNLLYNAVLTPELQTLLGALYGVPNPGKPRTDIQQIFLQGMMLAEPFTITTPGGPFMLPTGFKVNRPLGSPQPAEMLRLNTSFMPAGYCPTTPNYLLGLLGGDACGFPNGRRLADDVTDIELLAVGGAAWQPLTADHSFTMNPIYVPVLRDNINQNDVPFGTTFPYMASPHSGQYPGYSQVRSTLLPIIRR